MLIILIREMHMTTPYKGINQVVLVSDVLHTLWINSKHPDTFPKKDQTLTPSWINKTMLGFKEVEKSVRYNTPLFYSHQYLKTMI